MTQKILVLIALALWPMLAANQAAAEATRADYARAAEQLGCAVGTVRSRLHRARTILGAKLRNGERCPV